MPNCDRRTPADVIKQHDMCLATRLCRRCGASAKAIASGQRAPLCEPGVTGISWTRASERLREMIEGRTVQLPLLKMNDVVLGRVTSISVTNPLSSVSPFSIRGFDQHDDPPPSAA